LRRDLEVALHILEEIGSVRDLQTPERLVDHIVETCLL
jgi:hypothetical protein